MWELIVSVPDHCLSFYFDGLAHWFLRRRAKSVDDDGRRRTALAYLS